MLLFRRPLTAPTSPERPIQTSQSGFDLLGMHWRQRGTLQRKEPECTALSMSKLVYGGSADGDPSVLEAPAPGDKILQ